MRCAITLPQNSISECTVFYKNWQFYNDLNQVNCRWMFDDK